MKKFLMAAIAVFMMSGTAVAAENTVAEQNSVTVNANDNIADKLVAMINGYTKKVEATTSMSALEAVYAAFEKEMTEFEKNYSKEIAEFDSSLTEEMKEKYAALLQKAVDKLMAALEKKSEEFMGE